MNATHISRRVKSMGRLSLLAFAGLGQPALAADAAAGNAASIHARAVVLDAHADVGLEIAPRVQSGLSIDTGSNVEVAKLKAGKVDAIVLAVFEPTGPRTREAEAAAHEAAERKLQAIKDIARLHPRDVAIAYSPSDVRRIVKNGRIAILISFLNAYSLQGDVGSIERLKAQGVRIFGLAHAGNTEFADSSRPGPDDVKDEHGGLSDLGKKAVAEANRLGLLIDVSQLTTAGVMQTLSLSKAPVIASHSDARALVDNPRNLTDREIRAIAAAGGVVTINAFPLYLHRLTDDDRVKLAAIGKRVGGNPLAGDRLPTEKLEEFARAAHDLVESETSVSDLVDHLDYVVRLVGIDHVAISSDFNHGGGVLGWQDESQTENVTTELVRRGYSQADISKIWSGNFLRVLAAAERR